MFVGARWRACLQLEKLLIKVVDGGLLYTLVCVLLLSEPRPRYNSRVMQHSLEVPPICEAPRNPYSPNGIQPALQPVTSEETPTASRGSEKDGQVVREWHQGLLVCHAERSVMRTVTAHLSAS